MNIAQRLLSQIPSIDELIQQQVLGTKHRCNFTMIATCMLMWFSRERSILSTMSSSKITMRYHCQVNEQSHMLVWWDTTQEFVADKIDAKIISWYVTQEPSTWYLLVGLD